MLSILLVLAGIGLIASGIFKTDPLFGYPKEQPFLVKEFTVHGKLHSVFSLFVFIGLPIICFKMSRVFNVMNKRKWKYYSIVTGIIMLLLFLSTGFALNNFLNLRAWVGLIQRLCVVTGFLWISLWANSLRWTKTLS